jgi:hypothetical protein
MRSNQGQCNEDDKAEARKRPISACDVSCSSHLLRPRHDLIDENNF